jgi:hypothetical protein
MSTDLIFPLWQSECNTFIYKDDVSSIAEKNILSWCWYRNFTLRITAVSHTELTKAQSSQADCQAISQQYLALILHVTDYLSTCQRKSTVRMTVGRISLSIP